MKPPLIREMPEQDRPRERLKARGADALKPEELIAILLRTGTTGASAIQLAQELLRDYGDSLDQLVQAPLDALARRRGFGEAKAIQIKAAFDLARRLSDSKVDRQMVINAPGDAADAIREQFRVLDRESFRVLLLTTKNALIPPPREVSKGSLNASIVEPREVFKEAIAASAASVVLAHNHPSGDPTPSSEDIAITKRLVKAGELLNIAVLDHIILGRRTPERPQDFVSLKELGLM